MSASLKSPFVQHIAACLRPLASATLFFLWTSNATATDMATAEALFNEGRRLFDDGKIREACEKFSASHRIDPSAGTLLNLARCHESQGKTATAWAEYLAAKRAATADGRMKIAETASERAEALQSALAYLTINVARDLDGLQITRSDAVLEPASLGTKLPVDPGTHRVVARAPGYHDWVADVVVGKQESRSISIPALRPRVEPTPRGKSSAIESPQPNPRPQPPPPPPPSAPEPPTLAYVLGGVGVAAVGAGLVFGALAKARYDDALDKCPTRTGCSDSVMAKRADAGTFATVATVAVPLGLAAMGTGVVLYLMPSDASAEGPSIALTATVQARGALGLVEGSF